MDQQKQKVRVALLSVISNTTLVLLKLIVGIVIGSVSIISEAIHSGVDLIAATIALFSVRTSGVPADKKHPFGHGKIENISGTIEALLIFLAAGWIIYEAVKKFFNPAILESAGWGAGVMFISASTNIIVSHMLFKVGKETDSVALMADAWHLRTDVYTSVGVMVGLGAIWLGTFFAPGVDLRWVDPAAAILVAVMIIKAAYELVRDSARDLLDAGLPADEENWIRDLIVKHRPQIHGFHQMRTRKAGHIRFVEFHLIVDPHMSVEESHTITDDLTSHIEEHFPNTSVMIHIEPCDGNCTDVCIEGCFLNERQRQAVK
jgi:cation diffusion facilitator family transporter